MMKTKLIIAGAIALMIGGGLAFRAADRRSMIDCTLTWGRLAPFPSPIQDFRITTDGNMFTRAFRASFTAMPDVVESWIQQSPGLRNTTPDRSEPNLRKYQIKPGGGAQHAEVTIDDKTHEVRVYVCWS